MVCLKLPLPITIFGRWLNLPLPINGLRRNGSIITEWSHHGHPLLASGWARFSATRCHPKRRPTTQNFTSPLGSYGSNGRPQTYSFWLCQGSFEGFWCLQATPGKASRLSMACTDHSRGQQSEDLPDQRWWTAGIEAGWWFWFVSSRHHIWKLLGSVLFTASDLLCSNDWGVPLEMIGDNDWIIANNPRNGWWFTSQHLD